MKTDKTIIIDLTEYLINHADENNDGEIGFGLSNAWDAFSDGTINPECHVYTIETVNVMDAYLDSLNTGYLSNELKNKVLEQLYDIVLLWNTKYYSEKGNNNQKYYYWYSISKNDAIATTNIDAKMVGTQARLLSQYQDLFTDKEKELIYDHIDKTYSKIMEQSYESDGNIIWNYIENDNKKKNDAIHHGFILEGISDYQKYRLNNEKWDYSYNNYINNCVNDNLIYSYPNSSSKRCFDTGAIRWLTNKQKEIIIESYNTYNKTNTDNRQLSFLLDSISLYLSK